MRDVMRQNAGLSRACAGILGRSPMDGSRFCCWWSSLLFIHQAHVIIEQEWTRSNGINGGLVIFPTVTSTTQMSLTKTSFALDIYSRHVLVTVVRGRLFEVKLAFAKRVVVLEHCEE